MKLFKYIFFTLILIAGINTFAQQCNIVVNKTNGIEKISKNDLRKIFLGNKTHWDNGKKIAVVLLDKDKSLKDFLKKYVKKTPSSFSLNWKKIVYSGKGEMPKIFKDEKKLIEFLQNNENAIGFTTSTNGNLKVIVIK